jgi:hypothetical protein
VITDHLVDRLAWAWAELWRLPLGTLERSDRQHDTYEDASQFLADYRVRALDRNAPEELLVHSEWLKRQIADQFSKPARRAWRAAHKFVAAGGLDSGGLNDFDRASEEALDEMYRDLSLRNRYFRRMRKRKAARAAQS